jgi:hypothetical protein
MLSDIRRTFRALNSLLADHRHINPSMEIVYRELFLRELRRMEIDDEYYPVGSAASHGFLYFLARTLRTLPVNRILELGAGQTTLLIDRVRRKLGLDCEVETIEHDEQWAAEHQSSVQHRVTCAPLSSRTVEGHRIDYYSHQLIESGPPVDLLLVDGPPAHQRRIQFNRLGALDIVKTRLGTDFIIAIDDSQRNGEQLLVERVRAVLEERGDVFRTGTIVAARKLTVIAGGRLLKAAFY